MMSRRVREFQIKGRHVALGFVAAFLVVLAANGTFIILALTSSTGTVVPDAYARGLTYNDVLEAEARQVALGWHVRVTAQRATDDDLELSVTLTDKVGQPLAMRNVGGTLRRPTQNNWDRKLAFESVAPGKYRTRIEDVRKGKWDLHLVATGPGGEPFQAKEQLWLE